MNGQPKLGPTRPIRRTWLFAVAVLIAVLCIPKAEAAEIRVMISGGLSAAYKELIPQFEKTTGNTVVTAYGPSMGTTENAIPIRLARGEPADVLIMVGDALGVMISKGFADAGSRVDLVRSPIGMVVRAGAAKPDISTPEALKAALLAAKSVAYSDSASGVYVGKELFKKLGIASEMEGKARMIPADPVAGVVAHGEAELGFQQISELLPIPGAELVGPLPPELQKITIFSAALTKDGKAREQGEALINFLASPAAAPLLVKSGMEPIAATR
ncbi:substrate-binding domain-containing protein [Bradyrhizobium sp. USDA 4454]